MTTNKKTKHWDKLSNRERDAWGAEYIFKRPIKWFPCWRDPQCGTIMIQSNDPGDLDMSGFGGTTEPCYWSEEMDEEQYDDPIFWDVVPNYSTDASADYLILEKVASTWGPGGKGMFFESLGGILVQRHFGEDMNSDVPSIYFIEYLKPGDYLKSAWLSLTEE